MATMRTSCSQLGARVSRRAASVRAALRAPVQPQPNRSVTQVAQLAAVTAACAGLIASPAHAGSVGLEVEAGSDLTLHTRFFVDGMTVKPAAEGFIPNTGHFHVLIDAPPVEEGEPIPFDATHLHFGKGQTSADITLPSAGKHTLTLQFANARHESYGPEYATTVDVSVE